MIRLTEKAVEKVKEIAEAEGIGSLTIRVKILAGGCAGYSFDMEFIDQIGELDEVIEQDGISIVIDPISFQYMEGIVVDWADTTFGGGFKFGGGEIKSTCGCGSSIGF
jgi:iron-sulfur cluster insertion protein